MNQFYFLHSQHLILVLKAHLKLAAFPYRHAKEPPRPLLGTYGNWAYGPLSQEQGVGTYVCVKVLRFIL